MKVSFIKGLGIFLNVLGRCVEIGFYLSLLAASLVMFTLTSELLYLVTDEISILLSIILIILNLLAITYFFRITKYSINSLVDYFKGNARYLVK